MTKTAQTDRKQLPPYLPYRTFSNTLAGWRAALPGRIDRSVLGSYSGAMQGWVLASLRYFSLIDADGHPTGKLREVVSAEGERRTELLLALVHDGYPFLFGTGFDIASGTAAQLEEKFKDTGAKGDTVRRCMGFFMGLAKDAGVSLSPYLRPARRKASNGRKKAQPRKPQPEPEPAPPSTSSDDGRASRPDFQVLYELLDPESMDDGEQQAVWTLLMYVKRKGG